MVSKNVMNGKLIEAVLKNGEVQYCKIEWTDPDEYHVYNDEGAGVAIAQINSVQLTELFFTGSVRVSEDLWLLNSKQQIEW
ncbi:hypothetical protein HQN89_35570 [Paenibacillus frigoriresistens]|uniref:hypothetical protein n=1 Tax=Paenibacillus alginolyticus TaxID=59839 RepID=UPI001563F70C|nr:hypothetical protein [Paenibacillus frigoriresistens]NRF96118.1 hypothetical protein [Paenibacillus frigoriresistens]